MKANDDSPINMSLLRPNCKDCDRLIPKPLGEAGERPSYCQTTMYDHFENFQNFQKTKKSQEVLMKNQEKVLKFDPNFTNMDLLNSHNSQADLSQFNTQNMVPFRKQLRLGECNLLEENEEAVAIDESETTLVCSDMPESLKPNSSPLLTGRSPMICPLSNCNQTITALMILSHFLRDHNEEYGVQYQETFLEKPSNLIFDASSLEYDSILCLGILIYGGKKNQKNDYPAERGICMHNAFLPKPFEQFYAHLPILIMCYRTTWAAIITKGMVKQDEQHTNPKNDLLIIWLASVQTTEDVYGTITLYNREMSTSISSILKLRCISNIQDPKEFVFEEADFIRLGYYDINELSHNLSEFVHVEILINEYPVENLQKSHDQHKRMLLYRQRQYRRIMHHKHSIQNWLKVIENKDDKNELTHSSNNNPLSEMKNHHNNAKVIDLQQGADKSQNSKQTPYKKSDENLVGNQSNKISQSNPNEKSKVQVIEATTSKGKDKVVNADPCVRHYEHPDGAYAIIEAGQSGGKKKIIKLRLTEKKLLDSGSKYPYDTVSLRKCSREYRTMIKNNLRSKIKRALAVKRLLKQQQQQRMDNMEIGDNPEQPHEKLQSASRQDSEKQNKSKTRHQNGCDIRMNRTKECEHPHSKGKCSQRSRDNNDKCVETTKEKKACSNQQANGKGEKERLGVDQSMHERQSPNSKQNQNYGDHTHGIRKKSASCNNADCNHSNLYKTEHEIKQNTHQECKNTNYYKKDVINACIQDDCKRINQRDRHFTERQKSNVEGDDTGNIVKHDDEDKLKDETKKHHHQYNHNKASVKAELKELLEKIHAKFRGCEKQRRAMEEIQKFIKQLDKCNDKEKGRERYQHTPPSCCDDKNNFKSGENVLLTRTECKQHPRHDSNRENRQKEIFNEVPSPNHNRFDGYSAGGKSLNESSLCRKSTDDYRPIRKLLGDCSPIRKWSKEEMQESQSMKMKQTNEKYERNVRNEQHESSKKPERKQRIQENEISEKCQGGVNIKQQFRGRRETRVHNEPRSSKRTKSLDVKPLTLHENGKELQRKQHCTDIPHNSNRQNLKIEKFQDEIDTNKVTYHKSSKRLEKDLKYVKPEKQESSIAQMRNNLIKADYQASNENSTNKRKESNFKLDCSKNKMKMKRRHSYDSSHEIHLTNRVNSNSHNDEQQYDGVVCNEHHDYRRVNERANEDNHANDHCITNNNSPERIITTKSGKATSYSRNHSFTKDSCAIGKNYPAAMMTDTETEKYGFKVANEPSTPPKLLIGNVPDIILPHEETNFGCCGYASTLIHTDTKYSNVCQNATQGGNRSGANVGYCLKVGDDENVNHYDDDENGHHNIEINSILKTVYESIPELSE